MGEREVIVLIFKTLCYAMNSLLLVNMHRKVGVFAPLASLEEQFAFETATFYSVPAKASQCAPC